MSKLKVKAVGLMLGAAMLAGCSSTVTDADVRYETEQAVQEVSDQVNNLTNMADEHVQFVKGGTFNGRDDVTLGEVMEAFFDGPTWQYFSGTDEESGETYDVVEFTGHFLYNEKSAKARIQFILHEDDTFEMGAGSYNDIDQSALVLRALIEKVYESYDEGDASAASATDANIQSAVVEAEDVSTDETNLLEVDTTDQLPANGIPSETIGLDQFDRWSSGEADWTLSLILDGEPIQFVIGDDTPNGVKTIAFSESMEKGWYLPTDVTDESFSPFDDFGNLKSGVSLYTMQYDFAGDSVPEVVLVASDRMLETYVWVYSYDYTFIEDDHPPLSLAWHGVGQSDVWLSRDLIELPYGSQGFVDTYMYDGIGFVRE